MTIDDNASLSEQEVTKSPERSLTQIIFIDENSPENPFNIFVLDK